MKVMNWKRAAAATLLAAGCWAPSIVQAANIPLGDPSFEAYVAMMIPELEILHSSLTPILVDRYGRTPFHGPAHRVSKDLHTGEVHFSLYRLWANPIAGGNRPATPTFLRQ